ncbi:SurA N-terminal domain-containing protein [Candidatus Omnitrophota bacterium]
MLLKFLRKRKNMRRIIWGLAILIIPAFILWGAGSSRRSGKGPNYAGKVFDKKVSFEEYVDMWHIVRDYITKSFGPNVPPEFIDQLAWNRIILLEETKRQRIGVKDSDVVERIVSFPVFQRGGSFDKKLYKSMLGDSVRGFEEKLRDDIAISKLKEKITSSISVTDEEMKEEYKKKFEKIKASYVSIPFSEFEKDVKYKEEDVLKFYEENKETFRKSDEINVKYIEILFSGFDKEVFIAEESIKRYFEEHLSDFKNPDSEEMSTLSEEIKKEISEKLGSEKKKFLAEELGYKALDKSLDIKDLDECARSFGLETKETGFFSMQEEVPGGIGWSYEFTKKGFELEPGGISNVLIRTDKGFSIIQLKERKESYIPEFAEVKNPVIKAYIKDGSVRLAEEKAKNLYASITSEIKNGGIFKDIATQKELTITQTDLTARDGYIPLLGPAKSFIEEGASLKIKEIGGPVKMQASWVILQLDEYKGMDEVKFLEEKEGFKNNLLSTKKQKAFDKWFEGLKKEANFVSYTLE